MDMVFLLKCHLCVSLCFSCNIMLYFKKKLYIYIFMMTRHRGMGIGSYKNAHIIIPQ
jgi:hypothetical protein